MFISSEKTICSRPESFPLSVTKWGSKPGDRPGGANPWKPGDPHYYSFLWQRSPDRQATTDYRNLQAALEILQQPRERPFCIYPALDLAASAVWRTRRISTICTGPKILPPLRPPGLPRKPNFHEAIRRTRALDKLGDADMRKIQAVYLGMIGYSDWLLGVLMDAFGRTATHAGNTTVFTFADHGEWGGDYGLVEKWPSAMDDCLTRIPLIARGPGIAKGTFRKKSWSCTT